MDSIRFEPKLHNPSHRKEKKGGGAHLEVAGHRLRKGSGSSTTARPLDGGALTHGRTRAPARGTVAALTPSSGRQGWTPLRARCTLR